MFYTPVTEQEAMDSRFSLLEPGHYEHAKIDKESVEEGKSGKGNSFVKLTVLVKTREGHTRKITCYLTDVESMRYLTRHLAESVGLLHKYDNGTLVTGDFTEKDLTIKGGVHIDIQKARPKEDGSGESWSPKNIITDFGIREKKLSETGKKSLDEMKKKVGLPSDEFNDDIPF